MCDETGEKLVIGSYRFSCEKTKKGAGPLAREAIAGPFLEDDNKRSIKCRLDS